MAEHDADREPQPIDEEAAWAAIVAGYGEEPADPPGAKPFKSVDDLALLEGERNSTGRESDPGAAAPEKTSSEKTSERDPAPGTEYGTTDGTTDSAPGGAEDGPADAAPTPDATSTSDRPKDGPPDAARAPDGDSTTSPAEGTGTGSDTDPGPDKGTPALGSSIVFAPGVGGPRDYRPADPDDGEEGHFVPPEPPPLPEAEVTAKFAWLGVVGGPVLMLIAVMVGWEMTWWLTTLCVGGFLGGFVTLVARMDSDDDEDDDPGRGAVV